MKDPSGVTKPRQQLSRVWDSHWIFRHWDSRTVLRISSTEDMEPAGGDSRRCINWCPAPTGFTSILNVTQVRGFTVR